MKSVTKNKTLKYGWSCAQEIKFQECVLVFVCVHTTLYLPIYIIQQTSGMHRTKGQKDPMKTKNDGRVKERERSKHFGHLAAQLWQCVYVCVRSPFEQGRL